MYDFISSERKYCEGFFMGNKRNYLLGVYLSTAKKKILLSHAGSANLDEISVFDQAEICNANLGQINIIKVSSFCGPRGFIWGYDVCKADKIYYTINNRPVFNFPVFKVDSLLGAFKELVGTVDAPRFPFMPGSHVPCATKCYTKKGRCIIYSAVAIGVPSDRKKNACLFMEDVGEIPYDQESYENYKELIISNLVKSVFEIGRNQKVQYKEIFVGLESKNIEHDEVGCALIASPYFLLARDANPETGDIFNISIKQWINMIN
jgi:histidine decarboxylase